MNPHDKHGEFFESLRSRTHELLDQLMVENKALRHLAEALQADNVQLAARLGLVEKDLVETLQRRRKLEDQLAEIQHVSESLRAQYVEVEQQNLKITNLYVASYQLHGTLDRDEVLANIQEILANLIGTECYGIYERNGSTLELVRSMGAPFALTHVSVGEGRIGAAAVRGEIDSSEFGRPVDGDPVVCVPLRLGSEVTGVIAIFGFLPQKRAIEPIDTELFDLLATHAGTSLYCTRLHQSYAVRAQEAV